MFKPNIKKMIDKKNDLPPPPLLINKDKLIIDINNKLVEEKAGPESVILLDIKNPRRTWITYEYHLDIIYKIGDKEFIMLPNNYYDESNYPVVFEDQLYKRLARVQQSINGGY